MDMRKRVCECNKGLTLVEVLVVIIILGIIAGIALPVYMGRVEKTIADVCEFNRHEVKRQYKDGLVLDANEHSEILFKQYMDEHGGFYCPADGVYSFTNDEVYCDKHKFVEEEKDDGGDEVPWL